MPEAVSGDRNAEYLRRDVFDARMEAFMAEIRLGNAEIRKEMSQLESRIDAKLTQLENKFDGKLTQLENKFDGKIAQLDSKFEQKFEVLAERGDQNFAFLNMRIDAMQTTVYWGFALMGLFVAILGFLITFAPPLWAILRRQSRPSRSSVSRREVENIISASFDKYLGQRAGT